jgi:predicted membrane protein
MTPPSKTFHCFTAVLGLLTPLLCAAQGFRGEPPRPLVSFQVPQSQATYPLSINESGIITGYYISTSGLTSGFVRNQDGQITTFTVPGAAATVPVSINTAGDITGYSQLTTAAPATPQAFLRTPDGTLTTVAGNTYTGNGLTPVSINVAGEIIGNFPDQVEGPNIFISSPSGVVTTTTLSQGALYPTLVTGLNASGAIVGYASSASINFAQGFLWDGQGPVPSPVSGAGLTGVSVTGSTGTFPTALNAGETVVGCYTVSGVYYDFVRDPTGVITTLDIPGTVPACIATYALPLQVISVVPQSITLNDQGTITGYYTNAANVTVGFVRSDAGKLITFDHPGSTQTIPTSINNQDQITGYYSEGTAIIGFIREP